MKQFLIEFSIANGFTDLKTITCLVYAEDYDKACDKIDKQFFNYTISDWCDRTIF